MRVVVTGAGILSRIGTEIGQFWDNVVKGECVDEKNIILELPSLANMRTVNRMDRFSRLTLQATLMAIKNSQMDLTQLNVEKIGTVFSTVYGSLQSNEAFARKLLTSGSDFTSPTVFTRTVANACIGQVCMNTGLKGVSTMLMGSSSIGYSYDLICMRKANAIIAGGVEEYHADVAKSYKELGYTTEDDFNKTTICRPLDLNRDGISIREGAGVVIVEELDHAEKRDAPILCEIKGYGGAFSEVSPERALAPMDSKPFENSMLSALLDADLEPKDIDAVIFSASGSRYGDLAEALAFHNVFGKYAKDIPITSGKGIIGETIGASASIGFIIGALSLNHQLLPKTAGYSKPDSEIQLNVVTESKKMSIENILINSFDVGGNLSSIILSKMVK
ncbi:beta-ketoacyl synthase [Lysinibacillus sp. RC79]|uniref:beta-ketoacyl-[acyl-carrier-protein] synthase family protein n=1 Tax=Lysinibacillus sp. RC79 TaxID=3156296 RepID=UPI0035158584